MDSFNDIIQESDILFYSVEQPKEVEIVIKKSRFIGHVSPIRSTSDGEDKLGIIRELHKSANHNCFAYRVGLGVPVERFSDDGEPSGTAGRPILEVLRRRPILNSLAVVTRYFGGTLLGANGLVRAYADATAEAIEASTVLRCVNMHKLMVTCDYSTYGKLEYEFSTRGYEMVDKEYADNVSFAVWVVQSATEGLVKDLADWSTGRAQSELSDAEIVGVRPDGTFVFNVYGENLRR